MYADAIGLSACKLCPAGVFQTSTGATAAVCAGPCQPGFFWSVLVSIIYMFSLSVQLLGLDISRSVSMRLARQLLPSSIRSTCCRRRWQFFCRTKRDHANWPAAVPAWLQLSRRRDVGLPSWVCSQTVRRFPFCCLVYHFRQHAAFAGQSACQDCQPGKYAPVLGLRSCLLTLPGEFMDQAAGRSPFVCQPGSFSATAGATFCMPCTSGAVSSSNQSACSACAPGASAVRNCAHRFARRLISTG